VAARACLQEALVLACSMQMLLKLAAAASSEEDTKTSNDTKNRLHVHTWLTLCIVWSVWRIIRSSCSRMCDVSKATPPDSCLPLSSPVMLCMYVYMYVCMYVYMNDSYFLQKVSLCVQFAHGNVEAFLGSFVLCC
jgi:hypothetical protein